MKCWKTNAQGQFDAWSKSYDRSLLQRIFFRPSHEKIFSIMDAPEDGRFLDVGCGTGLFASRLLDRYPEANVVGLDISEQMLARARENTQHFGEQLQLIQGDSEHLPFNDSQFDAITCIHSFHHYPNQGNVLREMHRVLKPNGKLYVVDGNRDGWWGWFVFDGVVTTIEGTVHHCSGRQFRDLYAAAGFDAVEQVLGGGVAPFMVTVGRAHKEAKSLRRVA